MTIADLFVDIGVKGDADSVKGLSNVQDKLKDTYSTGLAAKAAIIGVVYGLQKMTMGAADVGHQLSNFHDITGLSVKTLEQYADAALQVGVSFESVESGVKGIQNAITQMKVTGQIPQLLSFMGMAGVNLESSKVDENNPFYLIQKLQEASGKMNPAIFRQMIGTLGIGEDLIPAFRRNAFNPTAIANARTHSGGDINNLNAIDIAWKNLHRDFNLFRDDMVAKNGLPIVKDLGEALRAIIGLRKELSSLSKELPTFSDGLKTGLIGLAAYFNPITAAIVSTIYLLSQYQKMKEGKESIFGEKGKLPELLNKPKEFLDWFTSGKMLEDVKDFSKEMNSQSQTERSRIDQRTVNNNVNINQTNHGVKDAEDSNKSLAKHAQKAVTQGSISHAKDSNPANLQKN